jgi:hypothetical protein
MRHIRAIVANFSSFFPQEALLKKAARVIPQN